MGSRGFDGELLEAVSGRRGVAAPAIADSGRPRVNTTSICYLLTNIRV